MPALSRPTLVAVVVLTAVLIALFAGWLTAGGAV